MSRLSVTVCLVLFAGIVAAQTYTVTDLGVLPQSNESHCTAISSQGNAFAGYSGDPSFLFVNGQMSGLPTLGNITRASGVNSSGVVCGFARAPSNEHPVVWTGGAIVDLIQPGYNVGYANSINDAGTVVGFMSGVAGNAAFVYSAGSMTYLQGLTGTSPLAAAINADGRIAGSCRATNFSEAAYWDNGQVHALPPVQSYDTSDATAVSSNGLIVGTVQHSVFGSEFRLSFLFDGTTMQLLPAMTMYGTAAAGVNDSGYVVGTTDFDPDGPLPKGFIYHNGQGQLLTSLTNGWYIFSAGGINNSGQIVGTGSSTGQFGSPHAVLLTPVPEPMTAAVLALGSVGFLRRRRIA